MDTSTSSLEHHADLQHMPGQDVFSFGVSAEMDTINLPTYRDVLKHYFFWSDAAKSRNEMFSYRTFTSNVADKLILIWSQLRIEMYDRNYIMKKLNRFLEKYKKETKNKGRPAYQKFVESTTKVFFIGTCQCNLELNACNCGKIPQHLKEFMFDQHNYKKLCIPECNEFISEIVTTTIETTATGPEDISYEPTPSELEGDIDIQSASVPAEEGTKLDNYTQRYDALNFAMFCDRFGIPDRQSSCLATALFKDINLKDNRGERVVMDRFKVAREKMKSREIISKRRYDGSTVIAFSYDGRKDDSLTREKIGEKWHPRVVKEPHLVVLREPGELLIGYVNLQGETAEIKCTQLCEFFEAKNLSLTDLIGIGSDGENTNTGVDNGVIRKMEIHLQKPLHWFICLLHFNELPLRHLYETLEKSVTKGPRASTGGLLKKLNECEKFQVQ